MNDIGKRGVPVHGFVALLNGRLFSRVFFCKRLGPIERGRSARTTLYARLMIGQTRSLEKRMFAPGPPSRYMYMPRCLSASQHTFSGPLSFPFWHSQLVFIYQARFCHDLAYCPAALLVSGSSLENKLKCHVAFSSRH